jgi:hypothetical protein
MYKSSLMGLRAQVQSMSTPRTSPLLVSPRASEPESTEDILSKSAKWLRDIQDRASELKRSTPPNKEQPSFAAGLSKGIEEASSRKEAFIKRRSENSPSQYAPQRPFETAVPVDAEGPEVLEAIAAVESMGSGDYEAIGPVVKKGMYKGQRAYGRYQVMEGNIAPWTKAALGKSLTVEEFMADPKAQDAVALHQLQMSKNKHGTWEDAASVWFSGRPMASAGNASDGYTTVPEYISKFRQNFKRS